MPRRTFQQCIATLIAGAALLAALAAPPAPAQAQDKPTNRERAYEKLRRDALKKYHDPKDTSFKREVDEAYG